MMRIVLGVVFIVTLGFHSATAAPITYVALLSGPAEDPPVASGGTGSAVVTLDDVANTLRIQVSFEDLIGTTTASHIHVINGPGDANLADTNGPVATTTPTFPGFPLGVTSGTYDMTFDLLAAATFNPSFVTAAGGLVFARQALIDGLADGRAYLNIHTSNFPGGEIRGFLAEPDPATVPEPTSLTLLGLGLAGMGAHRWRQSKQ